MSTRRVVLVSPYALSVFGGVQEQVLAMSRELSRRACDVLVLSPDGRDRATYDTPAQVLHFGRLLTLPANGSRAPLTLSWPAARDARRAIERFAPDVVHFHEPFAPLVGWSALRAHESAAVATFHRSGGGPAFSLTTPLLRRLVKGLDVVTAVSGAAARTIQDALGLEPEVLFNGFETDRFISTPRVREDGILLVCVGRLEERKGTAHAINAVRAHNARGGDQWRLLIIGEGPQRARLEALAAHDDAIVFAGALDDAAKRGWLRRANALLAPATRGESFGLVLLEAMASETLVVASDIPGYREAAGDHAALFTPGDELDLERSLARALADESPERVATARRHAERWSMTGLVDRYEELYDVASRTFAEPR